MVKKFNKSVFQYVYGVNVDIEKLFKLKTDREIWLDVCLKLVEGDLTKLQDLKNMKMTDVMDVLMSKVVETPKSQPNLLPNTGFQLPNTN